MSGLSSIFGGGSSGGGSFIDPKQQAFLNFVRNQGQGLVQQNQTGASNFASQFAPELFGFGQQALGQLGDNQFLSGLGQQAGGNPELVNQQIGQLGSDLGRTFNQQVLPGIRRDATAVGALGGSRQGVAEGIAGQGFADAFSRGVTDIQGADAQRSLQAGIAGGGLLAQGQLGGLSQLGSLFDVGLGQFTGGFAPLSLFSQILGPPTVLGSQQSSSTGGLASLLGSGGLFGNQGVF